MVFRRLKVPTLPSYEEGSTLPLENLFALLRSSEAGLSQREERHRLKEFGPNAVSHKKPPPWIVVLLKNFISPFVVLVLILGLVSLSLKQYDSAIIIGLMVVVGVFMRFLQEHRSSLAAERLKKLVSTTATVVRHNGETSRPHEIAMERLVPGDIIHLSAGDMIPADIRLLFAKDLFVSQSALTGEVHPVEKGATPPPTPKPPLESPNLCFLGTNVMSGSATALVLRTGDHTYFGKVATQVLGARPLTSFDLGINRISWLLIRFIAITAAFVFVINLTTKDNPLTSLLFSLAVAVGLTPEMLPMIVTTNLARGARRLAEGKVIVKQLDAIQNFGAMDILCTDKTGTLTQDKIILDRYTDLEGKESEEILLYAYLNATFQTGLKNLLDAALLEHTEMQQKALPFTKIDELPFDFIRRRLSVVVSQGKASHLLITKGAVREVAAICCGLTSEVRKKIDNQVLALEEEGLRVLGIAVKEVSEPKASYTLSDESSLTFLGFLAFLDPPKPTASQAIANLKAASVEVKILTGDSDIVTRKICQWVDLPIEGTLLGSEIEAMSEEELGDKALKTTLFARLSPLQKSRVILALKGRGHTVGYLGDGINDAPALRAADVGISVDTAVDIAKESSDIIMLKKDLTFLGEGVITGRKTFGNMIKYLKMAFSSNFGNVFTLVGASLIFPFFPMLPIQLLLQNLLYDFSQMAIPFDHVDKEFLARPRPWDPQGIGRFMLFLGPLSSLFDYVTFAILWFPLGVGAGGSASLFQTGWFIEGLLSQTLIVHMIRTEKIPFLQSSASFALLTTTALIVGVGIWLPFTGVGARLGFIPLPGAYFVWLTGIILAYALAVQGVKVWFIRKYKTWL